MQSGEEELRGEAEPGAPFSGVERETEGSGGDSSVVAKLGGGTGSCAEVCGLGVARVDGPEPGGIKLRVPITCGVVVARGFSRESNISADGCPRLFKVCTWSGGGSCAAAGAGAAGCDASQPPIFW